MDDEHGSISLTFLLVHSSVLFPRAPSCGGESPVVNPTLAVLVSGFSLSETYNFMFTDIQSSVPSHAVGVAHPQGQWPIFYLGDVG